MARSTTTYRVRFEPDPSQEDCFTAKTLAVAVIPRTGDQIKIDATVFSVQAVILFAYPPGFQGPFDATASVRR